MDIETYEVAEATTENRDRFEVEAEAQALISELGLEGQQELVSPDSGGAEVGTRIPYRQMTLEELRVYQTLYPERTAVSRYKAEPIPLRVLQVIAHAQTLFDKLEVWGPETQMPDPILTGLIGSEWVSPQWYLLARWGDALEPYDTLRERAIDATVRKWSRVAKKVMATAEGFLAAPEADAAEWIESGTEMPWERIR